MSPYFGILALMPSVADSPSALPGPSGSARMARAPLTIDHDMSDPSLLAVDLLDLLSIL